MIKIFLFFLLFYFPIFAESKYSSLGKGAADYICEVSKEKSKSRFAVFPFTDSKDEETKDSEIANTELIGALVQCVGIKLIDKSKLAKVLDEQSFGKSGIVDEETAPEMGKLIGAEGLVFGELSGNILQIRIIDSTSGEILGAKVQPANGGERKIEKLSKDETKKNFTTKNTARFLKRLKNNRPLVFIFVSATPEEFSEIEKKFPKRAALVKRKISSLEKVKKERLEGLKEKVQTARKNSPELHEWISKKIFEIQ